jgi:hypothetical protein
MASRHRRKVCITWAMNSLSAANNFLASIPLMRRQWRWRGRRPRLTYQSEGDSDSDKSSAQDEDPSEFCQSCEADGLCPQCKAIFSDQAHLEDLLSTGGYKHLKPRQVQERKDAGCKLCAAIYQRIRDLDIRKNRPLGLRASLGEESRGHLRPPFPASPNDILMIWSLEVSAEGSKKRGSWEPWQSYRLPLLANIRLFSTQGAALPKRFYSRKNTSKDTIPIFPYLAPEKVGMDSQWLLNESVRRMQECEESHQQCPKKSVSWLPTRVIDVGRLGYSSPLRLHVCKRDEKVRYAALSYCWGVNQQVITTKSSIADFRKRIIESSLPKTIQDAIKITRGLQIQYLWVDALCIIQDSEEDKTAEINEMGRIYKNASITIAALDAATAFQGFLKEVQPLDGAIMPFSLPNKQECSIKLVPVTHLPYPGTHSDHNIHLLDTRGWALQEFLLSPRLLLFSQTEVLWQCQQVHVDPVLPSSRQYHPDDIKRLPSSVFGLHTSDNTFNTQEERAAIWISFMRNYSRRRLTLNEDRWYAMAGIINDLSKVWQDSCLAGHWKSCLAGSLAWYSLPIDPPVLLTASVPAYTAPTWSWMSPWCPVNAYSLPFPVAKVISCMVTLSDSKTAFGPLQAGTLVLEAQAVLVPDLVAALDSKVRDRFKFKLDKPTINQNPPAISDPDEFGTLFEGCSLLKLGRRRAHGGVMGLILEEVGDGRFRRIGLGEYHDPDDSTARFWGALPWKQWTIV